MEKVSFKNQEIFVGKDVHKKQWSVSLYSKSVHYKTFSQPPYPLSLKTYVDKHFPDAHIHCAYEACKLGYWIYRDLKAFGYHCLVVNPADIPTTNKETTEKTDPIDSRKIAKALRGGLLVGIHVPSEETEPTHQ